MKHYYDMKTIKTCLLLYLNRQMSDSPSTWGIVVNIAYYKFAIAKKYIILNIAKV